MTGSLPIIQLYTGATRDIKIVVGDIDSGQVTRCRWSIQSPLDECGSVCLDLPNAQLNSIDCIISWTPVLRPADIANGLTTSTYVVAITAEDFLNSTGTTPLSSVPHQMLVFVSAKPSNACATAPSISGFPIRNLACYGKNV